MEIPERLTPDFASLPSILCAVPPTWGKYGPAAIIDEWLCWKQSPAFPKEPAGQVFREAMKLLGVGPLRHWVLYNGVKLFGGWAGRENARKKAAGVSRIHDLADRWPADLPYQRVLLTNPWTWLPSLKAGARANRRADAGR